MWINPQMRGRALVIFGALGFGLSIIVHLLTYTNIALQEQFPLVWGLHVGIFVVFVPFIRAPKQQQWLNMRTPFPGLPQWARIVLIFSLLYEGASFFWSMLHMSDMVTFGLTVLPTYQPHTHQYNIYQLRLVSSIWLAFYLLPTLFFLYIPSVPADSMVNTR